MRCTLCLDETDCLANSHIIPRALHHLARGEHPRLDIIGDQISDEFSQAGISERFLCHACEGKFNQWDTHGVEILRDKLPLIPESRSQIYFTLPADEFRYGDLKMFVLSMLWRADAAQHAVFSRVGLGPTHRDRLRQRVLSNDPGTRDDYAVVVSRFNEVLGHEVLQNPFAYRDDEGLNHLRFYVYCGFSFEVKVDQRISRRAAELPYLEDGRDLTMVWRRVSPSERASITNMINARTPENR